MNFQALHLKCQVPYTSIMINSRDIKLLHSRLQPLARVFVANCQIAGVPVQIISTLRDVEYQNFLYAQGRTRQGDIVTKAKGGNSRHEVARAFDFVPLTKGQADFEDKTKASIVRWEKCGKIGQALGLQWGGDPAYGFVDRPHFQMTDGLTRPQAGVLFAAGME